MMKNYCSVAMVLLVLMMMAQPPSATAADIARDLRSNAEPDTANGGYFELGVGAVAFTDPFVGSDADCEAVCTKLIVGGAYYYQGAFIELADATVDGVSVGYNLWQDSRWSLDFLAANIFDDDRSGAVASDYTRGGPNPDADDDDYLRSGEALRDFHLATRSKLMVASGLRLTGYFGNTMLQYRLVTDVKGGNGVVSSLRLGHNWQYRNWNFHAIASAEYYSATTSNYWIGVSPQEATTLFHAYYSGDTVLFSAELGATYPLTEHWVAKAFYRYGGIPQRTQQSPLIDESIDAMTAVALSYAF
jgi:MipA family protein